MIRRLPLCGMLIVSMLLAGCPSPPNQDKAAAAASSAAAAASAASSSSTYTLPPDTKTVYEALAKAGRPTEHGEIIDTQTFPYPVVAGKVSTDGYPIYLIKCSDLTKMCTGPNGEVIGAITTVARNITPIRNIDVMNPLYHCAFICSDSKGAIVGSVSPEMVKYLTAQKASTEAVVPPKKP